MGYECKLKHMYVYFIHKEPCIALYSANNGKKDPAIRRGINMYSISVSYNMYTIGINWLLDSITERYNQINEQVMRDMAVQVCVLVGH